MPTKHPKQKASYSSDEDLPPVKTLSALIMSRVDFSPTGPAYGDEEEKRHIITQLVRLKADRKTDKECAGLLKISIGTVYNYK